MTVPSMPIWSAETRSMWRACSATPRKKLPPPTTMATSTPDSRTSAISMLIWCTGSTSTPKPRPAASASPESLSRMRLYMLLRVSHREGRRTYSVRDGGCDAGLPPETEDAAGRAGGVPLVLGGSAGTASTGALAAAGTGGDDPEPARCADRHLRGCGRGTLWDGGVFRPALKLLHH